MTRNVALEEPVRTVPASQEPRPKRRSLLAAMAGIIRLWIGGAVSRSDEGVATEDHVDWLRIIPFIAVHLMCLCVIWTGWSLVAVAVAAALYFLRMFAITAFYHRYFSHRTFQTSRFCQFIFAVAGNSAVQRGPLWWSAHHRHHHRYSDQEEDVHSPHQHSFLWSHMGWITSKSNFGTKLNTVKDLAKFPELRLIDRYETLVPLLLAAAVYGLGAFLQTAAPSWGTSGFQMLVWGFFVSTVAVAHATFSINSLTHLFGRKRYRTNDESRNSLLLALITLGEGWHNNHHYYPGTPRQGFYWWEIDITYYGLLLLSRLGLIWNLNPLPAITRESNHLPKRREGPRPKPA